MTVDELLAYCQSMYSSWDDALCARLRRLFDLPGAAKVKRLSRGMTAKLALVSSLAYRPELIMLDEPFSGLDPLAREELIRGLLEIVEQEKWTVFISSHDIHEVERLADWIGVLDEGELKLCEAADALRRRFREVEVVTESTAEAPVSPPISWINVKRTGRCIRFIESEYENKVGEERVRARIPSVKTIDTRSMTLRQIFLALAESYRPKAKEFER
jgi:ABC-2 type transport system ATP-binding protein